MDGSLRNEGSFDIVVVGAGPVGAAAALALSAAGYRLLLLESRANESVTGEARPIALSHGSRLILERLGLWSALSPATAIHTIHVSQRGRYGRTRLTRDEVALPALGYVVDYHGLVRASEQSLGTATLQMRRGARLIGLAHDERSARVEFETDAGVAQCFAALVVVADGSAAGLDAEVRVTDYRQRAISARVATDRAHNHIAFERFTPEGPLALLPFENDYALVWTLPPDEAEQRMASSDAVFLAALQDRFGDRAGRFTGVSGRVHHRLSLRYARNITEGRAVLIGNAAQSLHPVAGQGLNVGLRDAWELTEAVRANGPGSVEVLRAYRNRRAVDRNGAVGFTHGLVSLFSNDVLPIAGARGLGLALLDSIPPLKRFVVKRMVFGARG